MSTRSRRGLGTWLTSSHTPLFVLDERRVVLVFNRGCEELTQWPAAEIIGKTCHLQSTADPGHWASLTGQLCPPALNNGNSVVAQRVALRRRDGVILERDIHYFRLSPEIPDDGVHLVGIIAEPLPETRLVSSRRLDVARHLAELHEKYRVDRLIAKSPSMQRVANQIQLARCAPASVHLYGEAGTGKEHIARLIHYGGPDRQQRFIPLRCGQTSAFEVQRVLNRLNDFEVSPEPVAIYLDQVHLLERDLQNTVATMIGQPRFRYYSSSTSHLAEFDSDLFSDELRLQLTSVTIEVPPLRSRAEDLPLLAQQLLEELNQTSGTQKQGVTAAVERSLLQYNWPGNLDEFSRVLQLAFNKSKEPLIDIGDLPSDFQAGMNAQTMRPLPVRAGLEDSIAVFEKQLIEQALLDARGNKSVAADILKIPRAKLYRRMATLGLAEHDNDPPPAEDALPASL